MFEFTDCVLCLSRDSCRTANKSIGSSRNVAQPQERLSGESPVQRRPSKRSACRSTEPLRHRREKDEADCGSHLPGVCGFHTGEMFLRDLLILVSSLSYGHGVLTLFWELHVLLLHLFFCILCCFRKPSSTPEELDRWNTEPETRNVPHRRNGRSAWTTTGYSSSFYRLLNTESHPDDDDWAFRKDFSVSQPEGLILFENVLDVGSIPVGEDKGKDFSRN